MAKYPCRLCGSHCDEKSDSIECSHCQGWTHKKCLSIDEALFREFSHDGGSFRCKPCAFSGDSYDYQKALDILKPSSNYQKPAKNELLLMRAYDVCLPKRTLPCQMKPDKVAIQILQKYQPVLLDTVVPLSVIGDGNCMYRASSLGVYASLCQ